MLSGSEASHLSSLEEIRRDEIRRLPSLPAAGRHLFQTVLEYRERQKQIPALP